MFGWLFGKKKVESLAKVVQKAEVSGSRNRVVQTTNVVNQRGAQAKGDIVGRNKYSTYSSDTVMMYPAVDPVWDLTNPTNPLSPLNPMNQPDSESKSHSHSHSHSHDSGSSHSHSHSHSHDSGSSYHSHDSSSSSSYDSGSSSSYDSSSY